MGFRWLDLIRAEMPSLSIRAEMGMPDRLTRFLIEGVVQSALIYTPQLRPGIQVEKVTDDELILVSSSPKSSLNAISDSYVFVDWGPEFVQAHAINLPDLTNPGLTFALGSMTVDYISRRDLAAYVPARSVEEEIAQGRLHLVPDAPRFPYPVFHAWREDLDDEVIAVARNTLYRMAQSVEVKQEKVIEQLVEISEQDDVLILGEQRGDASEN